MYLTEATDQLPGSHAEVCSICQLAAQWMQVSDSDRAAVMDAVRELPPIPAIKAIRERLGWGLSDAKAIFERLRDPKTGSRPMQSG